MGMHRAVGQQSDMLLVHAQEKRMRCDLLFEFLALITFLASHKFLLGCSEVRVQLLASPARDCKNGLHIDCFEVASTASSGGAKFTGGFVERVVAGAVRKLRQRSSGIAATHMSASWLMMKPTSQGKAFCMKP